MGGEERRERERPEWGERLALSGGGAAAAPGGGEDAVAAAGRVPSLGLVLHRFSSKSGLARAYAPP